MWLVIAVSRTPFDIATSLLNASSRTNNKCTLHPLDRAHHGTRRDLSNYCRSFYDVSASSEHETSGYTESHYDGLVKLYDRFKASAVDFNILAFPCNQFGEQE